MPVNKEKYLELKEELRDKNVTVVAVSKTKPIEDILELYELGQRDFGENYVQELLDKQSKLPQDIRWHFIGHLQSNKVKFVAPFVHLIHSVDSYKLLKEINKQGAKANRTIPVLLQMHIAQEETKYGLDENELTEIIKDVQLQELKNVNINGLMGMASFTNDEVQIKKEFNYLKDLFSKFQGLHIPNWQLQILSMGMTSDYKIAVEQGSTMLRIGSMLFGARNIESA